MGSALELKKQAVKEIKEKISDATSVVLVDYKGLNVAQDTELRREFREQDIEYKVLKNRLVKIAFNELGYKDFDQFLEGPTAVAFSKDPIAPAKVIMDNSKKFKKLEPKCALVDGAFVDVDGVKSLAEMPPKEVLIAKMLGSMQSPITGFVRVLNGTVAGLAIALKAIADQKA